MIHLSMTQVERLKVVKMEHNVLPDQKEIAMLKLFDGDVKEFESFLSEFDSIPPLEGYLAYGFDTIIVSIPTIQKAICREKELSLEECHYILNGLQT